MLQSSSVSPLIFVTVLAALSVAVVVSTTTFSRGMMKGLMEGRRWKNAKKNKGGREGRDTH